MSDDELTPAQVLMLITSAAMHPLPDDLRALAKDPQFWKRMIGRSRSELNEQERRMLDALGVPRVSE